MSLRFLARGGGAAAKTTEIPAFAATLPAKRRGPISNMGYQWQRDVSMQQGRPAGIDPVSGRVWSGDSILAISQQLEAEGVDAPLYFESNH